MKLEVKNNGLYIDNKLFKELEENHVNDFSEKMIVLKPNDFEIIKKLSGSDIIENILFEGLIDDIIYELFKNDKETMIRITYYINVEDWKETISPKSYCNKFSIYSDIFDINYDDGNISIDIVYGVNDGDIIEKYFEIFYADFKKINDKVLNSNIIENSIFFSSEHLTAGSSILQYFGKLLQEKYPDEKVSVSIKQEGLKVTMIVETPDGKKEEVEEYLNRYGMVIMNQLPPEEFVSNPIQLVELKRELRDAQNKIISQQEILSLKDETYKNRILSLEDEVKFLREEFSAIRKSNDENIKAFLSSLLTKDKLIKKLTKSIDNRNEEETKQLLLELKEKDSKGYVSLKEHIDNIIAGNLTNAPSWFELIITHFPK